MLKVGLVGVGNISGAHIPSWKKIEGVSLVALCDVRPEKMDKYEDVRKYTDFDEMLEKEELDILDICLPTFMHADFAVKAMEKGINVLCEKPISLMREDVKRVYETAQKNNVKFMVAQVLRFWPEYVYIKSVYESGEFGKLLSGTMTRLSAFPGWTWDDWMRDEERSGWVPYDLHIHDLDFMVYAFGAPKKSNTFRSKQKDQDFVNTVYEFDGFCINTESSWYASPYKFKAQFRFQFENAVVANEGDGLKVYKRGGEVIDINFASNDAVDGINLPKSNAYSNEIIYFTECVKNNVSPDIVKPEELETVIDILNNL